MTRLEKICECTHKILAKYTSNGMIKYYEAPQFHDLVENWDYRMICILEVYTQNRNEDDFLENLVFTKSRIKPCFGRYLGSSPNYERQRRSSG